LGEVPVLAEVLDACRGVPVNVEVKDPDPRATDGLLALLAERSAGDEPADDVLVSSFHLEVVDRVRAAEPGIATGALTFGVPPADALLVAHERGHGAVHPDVWTLLGHDDVGAFVEHAHSLHVRVHVWTVNDVDQLFALRDAGVDAVFTDDDTLYRFGVRGRRG
jgi:glycerophosphoryl diester phosphodiesterase